MDEPERPEKMPVKISDLLAKDRGENSVPGMSLQRYEEIKEAEAAGRPIKLSEGEQASYQDAEAAMESVRKVAQRAAGKVTAPILKQMRESLFPSADIGRSVRAVTEQQNKVNQIRSVANPVLPAPDYEAMVASASAAAAERARLESEERELQKRQTSALEAMAEGAEEAGRLQTRFNWAILIATIIGVLVATAALIVTIAS